MLLEPGLVALLELPASPVSRYVTVKAEATAELARQNVAATFTRRSGTLEDSIGVFPRETPDGIECEVGTEGAPYGKLLEEGTEPHDIYRVNAPFLWSLWSDPNHPNPLILPAVSVDHPGTPPRPWLEPALRQVILGG